MTRIEQGQHILKMIEAVDVNDTDTLDEVDKEAFEFIDAYYIDKEEEPLWLYNMRSGYSYPELTRSLDALHDAMPDGWYIKNEGSKKGWWSETQPPKKAYPVFHAKALPTMHLAWLHVIIQAYIYMEEKGE